VLAGKFMIKKEQLSVLGRPPFHDTALVCEGELAYLGGSWRRDVAFAGNDVNLQGDISAGDMIYNGTYHTIHVSLGRECHAHPRPGDRGPECLPWCRGDEKEQWRLV
jgi:hypothetical protein